jgi:hypothetical protein
MYSCDVPFSTFADIGKILPNLNRLELINLNLIKSTADIITEKDIIFPPNLTYLKFSSVHIFTTDLLSDPFKFLLEIEHDNFEYFNLSKISISILKYLDFSNYSKGTYEVEEFLDVNPNLDSLSASFYNLNITNRLNSLKSLDIDDSIFFYNIDQGFILDSIINITFHEGFLSCEFVTKLSQLFQLCPNLIYLKLYLDDYVNNLQSRIDKHLSPALSRL